MKLDSEFYKLPLCFDVERLKQEALSFPESYWNDHPNGFPGNKSLILVSVNGSRNDDYKGPMSPTLVLDQCPYIKQVMAAFDSVIGRSRLMRLEPGAEVNPHYDAGYSWTCRTRIHIPIITDPSVRFICEDEEIHMKAGEVWTFDNWKLHSVVNDSDIRRIHLVVDTTGTSSFWEMISRSKTPNQLKDESPDDATFIPYVPDKITDLEFEKFNTAPAEPPSVINHMVKEILDDLSGFKKAEEQNYTALRKILTDFRYDWQSIWSVYGDTKEGIEDYEVLIEKTIEKSKSNLEKFCLDSNGNEAMDVIEKWFAGAVNTNFFSDDDGGLEVSDSIKLTGASKSLFTRPIFIVSAPRSGSTMFFEILSKNMDVWTTGDETHHEFESIPELNIANRNYDSNCLTSWDATPRVVQTLLTLFVSKYRDSEGGTELLHKRFLEKTPKNSLRISFLSKIFPDALFIHLYRNPRQNISSIMDAWKSGNFVTYPELPGWEGAPWSLLLPEGWRTLNDKTPEEIAAYQWEKSNLAIMQDLAKLPDNQRCLIRYEDILENKESELKRICDFAGIPFGPKMKMLCEGEIPLSRYTLTKPDPDKWKRFETEIERVIPSVQYIDDMLHQLYSPVS